MLCRILRFFAIVFIIFTPMLVRADDIPAITITDKTNPKIVELYQKLQDKNAEIAGIESERRGALEENATAMYEKEQSLENKTLTATTTAATGLGAMEAASAYAKQLADADAAEEMSAYITTMKCEYGGGKQVNIGDEETLPGGGELSGYYTEYKQLAERLKATKAALNLRPGIESQILYDRAESGIYQYQTAEQQSGAYTSLSRALMNPDGDDATAWNTQKQENSEKLKAGLIAVGGGIVAGVIGNYEINKDAPKESSTEINREYDDKVSKVNKEKTDIETELAAAIEENAKLVADYNGKITQLKKGLPAIKAMPESCQVLVEEYVAAVENLELIENETDFVSDTVMPEVDSDLLTQCAQCNDKGAFFDTVTKECKCPADKPVEEGGKCVEELTEVVPGGEEQSIETIESGSEEVEKETPVVSDDPNICAVGLKHTAGFGIVAGQTRVGDRCTSALVLDGTVFKRKNGTCGCSARQCETRNGRAPDAVGGVCVCDKEKGYKDENGKCVKSTDESKTGTVETTEPTQQSVELEPKKEYKYYNCGNTNKGKDNWDMDTKKANPGVECEYINNVFNRHNVTPAEAEGLMKEWALENRKDTITCDEKSHRTQAEIDTYDDKWRNCVSTGLKEKYYEFVFKSLTNGNLGFYESLCSIYGLKQAGDKSACKKANKVICDKISAAVSRTFFHDGNAVLQGTECVINQSSNSNVSSSVSSGFQTKITASDDLHTISNVDLLQFYDKAQQVSVNQDVYRIIRNYLFNDLRLPVKEFSCDTGFTDNIKYFKGTRQELSAIQKAQQDCIRNVDLENADSEISMCYAKHKIETISGDLLSCTYGGQSVDFLFKKLDAIWDHKSTAGYQAMLCASEGGYFTDKSCVLADKKACDDFNVKFKQQYPNSKGMEWDGKTCVLKDVVMVKQVQRLAETTGFVALTLVSAVAGGPVVWALTALEGTALVTEAVTAGKLSDWAERFLVDAVKCNNSNCADVVFKDHIARIIYGSRQFSEKQNKEIANHMSRLATLLDKDILDKMLDAGINFGIIDQNREPDLEKALCKYYDKKLTNSERALLGAKQISTFFTFATVIGAGVTAGLRQAFKRNWIHISPERQAKWLKYKILKPDDVAGLTSKTEKAAPAAGKIDDVASGTSKTWEEELAEIGVKEEKTASGAVRYKDTKNGRYISQDEVLKRIDNMPGKNTTPKPVETSPSPKPEEIKPVTTPVTPQSRVYEKLGDKIKTDIANIKSGKSKELYIPKNQLTDEEWKILKEDLAKDGLEISEDPSYRIIKKATNATPNTTPKPVETKPETKPKEPETPKNSPVGNPVKSKSQKIAEARKRGDLGYHGTDADIAMDDMIRPSSNTANLQGKVQYGYGIAKDYDAAERYAVRRVVERQNVGKDLDFVLDTKTNTLIITNNSTTPLNLSKKTGYVYTTAKDSDMAWEVLRNGYAADYAKGFEAAQMPNAVEILDKKAFNIDDLVRQGKVKIVEPNVPKTTPKPTPKSTGAPASTTKPVETKPKTTPKPAETKPVSTPATPKRTPAQEEAQWRTLYEKYAPENQTFETFKKSFGNNLDEAEEYAKNWDEMLSYDEAINKANTLWDDFHQKYDDANSYSFGTYVDRMDEAKAEAKKTGIMKLPDSKTPGLESWTPEQFEDARELYNAQTDAKIATKAPKDAYYSTWDPNITKLRRELQGNNVSGYTKELNDYINKQNINLTREEADNIGAYIQGKKYDTSILSSAFSKDSGLNTMTEQAKNKYQELLLTQKSKNVNKIDEVAGISKKNLLGRQVAKNEFVQNFVSKRVSMYEDIITKNPSIYNRAKRWKQLSIEDREKLCKEIFEIADTKLGVEHTEFAVKDLVAMGEPATVTGLQTGGNVYLSSRHFPNMSFSDVMDTIAHEQAHKVDRLNPNKGILGSQLADLGSKEGYIQGYAGHSYADYRKELTEQSSWLIGDAMKKAMAKLGL